MALDLSQANQEAIELFGVPVVFTTSGGTINTTVIFDLTPVTEEGPAGFNSIQTKRIEITCLTPDILNVAQKDTVLIKGSTYRVNRIESDNYGTTRMTLLNAP